MQKIVNILPHMVESLGIDKKFKSQLVMFYWNKIVGNDIAAQSTPVEVEYGVLFIAVDNSVWCHHLLMMKADILHKINQFIGEPLIRDLKFKNQSSAKKNLEEIHEEEENFKIALKSVKLDSKEIAKVNEKCELIKDNDLKNCIYHVYEKHLRLKKIKLNKNWHKCDFCDSLCPEEERYCSICSINQRQKKLAEIRNELSNVPWATYAEINQYIPCTSQEYIDAKVTLLHHLSSEIASDDESSIKVKTLTMLFTGAKHDKIDGRLIQKTLAKFRRKNYVFTSRS